MKKGLRTGLIIIGIILVLGIGGCAAVTGTYNNLVSLEEGVKSAWGQVENQFQRRYDLIPNLVSTVKGYANFEQDTLTSLTEARSRVGGVIQISDDILNDPDAFSRYQQAQGELTGALQRLLSVTENYPELKANENFLALQDQLEGTENRISVERMKFNEAVEAFNVAYKKFPGVIIARLAGFNEKKYFRADEAAASAPKVEF